MTALLVEPTRLEVGIPGYPNMCSIVAMEIKAKGTAKGRTERGARRRPTKAMTPLITCRIRAERSTHKWTTAKLSGSMVMGSIRPIGQMTKVAMRIRMKVTGWLRNLGDFDISMPPGGYSMRPSLIFD
jgi:hypothetical protein